eukprot:8488658-Alexandrium_andersonii.AAC.1
MRRYLVDEGPSAEAMPVVGLTWSTQKEGRMDSRSDRLDPARGDWYGNKRKPWEKDLLRSMEDGSPIS